MNDHIDKQTKLIKIICTVVKVTTIEVKKTDW